MREDVKIFGTNEKETKPIQIVAGPLSFEYYLDGMKIITNCGFGSNISSKAELISRFTASQSTLTINDTSITKFEIVCRRKISKSFDNSSIDRRI